MYRTAFPFSVKGISIQMDRLTILDKSNRPWIVPRSPSTLHNGPVVCSSYLGSLINAVDAIWWCNSNQAFPPVHTKDASMGTRRQTTIRGVTT